VSNKSQIVAQAIQQSKARSTEPKPDSTQVIPVVEQSKGAKTTQGLSPETLKLLQALKDRL
jgi:hypothetical protein